MMTNSRLMSARRVLEHLIGYNSLHTQERKLEQLQYCHSSTNVTKLSKNKVITNILFSSMQRTVYCFIIGEKSCTRPKPYKTLQLARHRLQEPQNFTTTQPIPKNRPWSSLALAAHHKVSSSLTTHTTLFTFVETSLKTQQL